MRLRSHFFIQLVGAALSTFAFILLTPLLLSSLGLERYGLLLLVLSFLIYTNLAELGLGGAVSREIAACNEDDQSLIFGNAVLLSSVLACLGGLLFSLLALPIVANVFLEDPKIIAELSDSVCALFALGALSIVGSVPRSVLFGLSSFVPLNLVSIVSSTGSLIAPSLYASYIGSDLPGLLAAIAASHLAAALISFLLCHYQGCKPAFTFNPSIARTLLSYGGWSTASGIVHRMTNSLDRPLISSLVGPAAVTFFAIPEAALNRAHLLSGALLSAAFPRLAQSPYDTLLINTCYRGVLLMTPLFVVGILSMQTFLALWLGSEFAGNAHSIAVLLAIAIWLEVIGRVPYALLQARSGMREETKIATIILFPNLILLLLSINFFGIIGAATVAIFRSAAFFVLRARVVKIDGGLRLYIFGNGVSLLIASLATLQQKFIGSYGILIFGGAVGLVLTFVLNCRYGSLLAYSVFPFLKKSQHPS